MKIDDTYAASSDLRSQQVERTQQATIERRARARRDAGGDSVNLSNVGVYLARALSEASPGKIAELIQAQQAYEAGNFSEPTEEVADALLEAAVADTALEALAFGEKGPSGPTA